MRFDRYRSRRKSSAALDDGTAFVVALKTLKALLFGEASCGLVVAKYLQKITVCRTYDDSVKKTEYPATPSGVLDGSRTSDSTNSARSISTGISFTAR
ncbi:MAG: hypothetical protein ACLUSP_07630 [Christensenellales bacterium]